jgi:hypothetical protein
MEKNTQVELEKGIKSAKLTSNRQAYTRAIINGIMIAVAILNPWNWFVKIGLLFILFLIYGALASSEKFKNKL